MAHSWNTDKKTKNSKYRSSRRFDKSCRCNGGCPYCLSDRMHKNRVEKLEMMQQLGKEYFPILKKRNRKAE